MKSIEGADVSSIIEIRNELHEEIDINYCDSN